MQQWPKPAAKKNYRTRAPFDPVAYCMWILYQLTILIVLLVAGPFLLLRRGRHYLSSIGGRLGAYHGAVEDSPLWIHAVSVGEVAVASTLIRALPKNLPILLTTITPTGQDRAIKTLGDRATIAYLPFDFGFVIEKFLRRFRPRGLVLVEGDFWPLLLERTAQRELPIVVVNGRISDQSFRRMSRLKPFLGPIFDRVDRFGMQTSEDSQRLEHLEITSGKIKTLGNLKFDSAMPDPLPEVEATLTDLADDRPILIAGSTMPGEEEQVLNAFEGLGGGEVAMLVLAPRHPERWTQVETLIRENGLDSIRRSAMDSENDRPAVVLLDTLGELSSLYRIALGVFVGGTLVPTGGHNPLEAAQHGVAVVVGPSMENFREISQDFQDQETWRQVDSAAELEQTWRDWILDPESARVLGEKGRTVVDQKQGALEKTLQFLQPMIYAESEQEGDPQG